MNRRSILAMPAIAALSSLRGRRAFAADKIRVGMLKPNIVTVIYWIAVKTGAFNKNGLNVVAYPFPSGQTAAGSASPIHPPSTSSYSAPSCAPGI